ncbi:hypothetical protein MSG28_011135 [Choristoneura fumiferana]|uniref:Uncharacterized protein n=1 Tax=Choristoneura fumiferana TaxID=7141 RepID=A0ACC0KRC0_CHOFU|nr:hypothetical protein MSG28_011135 [Choristoneura fumiferana]
MTTIASNVNCDESIKRKWKSMRDAYMKYKKQIKGTTGSGRKTIHFMWAAQLSFLDSSISPRETESNIYGENGTPIMTDSDTSTPSPSTPSTPSTSSTNTNPDTDVTTQPLSPRSPRPFEPSATSRPANKKTAEADVDSIIIDFINKKKEKTRLYTLAFLPAVSRRGGNAAGTRRARRGTSAIICRQRAATETPTVYDHTWLNRRFHAYRGGAQAANNRGDTAVCSQPPRARRVPAPSRNRRKNATKAVTSRDKVTKLATLIAAAGPSRVRPALCVNTTNRAAPAADTTRPAPALCFEAFFRVGDNAGVDEFVLCEHGDGRFEDARDEGHGLVDPIRTAVAAQWFDLYPLKQRIVTSTPGSQI